MLPGGTTVLGSTVLLGSKITTVPGTVPGSTTATIVVTEDSEECQRQI